MKETSTKEIKYKEQQIIKEIIKEITTKIEENVLREVIEIIKKQEGTALPDTYSESDDVISKEELIKSLAESKDIKL